MSVSNSWLVNVSVGINTTVVQAPMFNNGMLLGVMPTQSSPYQCPPTSWGSNLFQVYSSASGFNAEFDPIIAAAVIVGDVTQINRLTWLSDSVTAYFSQNPSPLTLTVMKMDPTSPSTNYSTLLANLSAANNNWYGFEICDNIPVNAIIAPDISTVVVQVTTNAAGTVHASTLLGFTGTFPTQLYVCMEDVVIPEAGTYNVTFYSSDVTTVLPIGDVTSVSYNGDTDFITSVTNAAASVLAAVPLSEVIITYQNTGYTYLATGTYITGTATPTSPYLILTHGPTVVEPATNTWPFYSLDTTTNIAINSLTSLWYQSTNAYGEITYPQTNLAKNTIIETISQPGILTPTTGIVAALANLRGTTLNNPKKLLLDSNDTTVAQQVQAAGGSKDLLFCYHSLNLQTYTAPIRASLSSASLSAYFTNLFNSGVGMKPLSSMQIIGQPIDTTIKTANIGQPGVSGSSSNLIGWNNNVYAGFGRAPGIGLIQYGFMSNSIADQLVYLDQVVGADFIQLTAQADLVTFIISQQSTGGILYNNEGIQQIVSVFKGSIQKSVDQNILQSPLNSAYVYKNYEDVSIGDITNRIYKDLYFNGNFLSRIQQIALNINMSL